MNKWTREQRNQIILLAMGTVGVAALIWFGIISALQARLGAQADKMLVAQGNLNLIKAGIAKEAQFNEEIEVSKQEFLGFEAKMAQGDLYRWVINFLRDMEKRRNISIVEFGPPQIVDLNVPPRVPYKAGSYSISGTAYFNDLGSFVADLENSSPFVRLKSLTLQSMAPGLASAAAPERLTFKLEFITLIKPTAPQL